MRLSVNKTSVNNFFFKPYILQLFIIYISFSKFLTFSELFAFIYSGVLNTLNI